MTMILTNWKEVPKQEANLKRPCKISWSYFPKSNSRGTDCPNPKCQALHCSCIRSGGPGFATSLTSSLCPIWAPQGVPVMSLVTVRTEAQTTGYVTLARGDCKPWTFPQAEPCPGKWQIVLQESTGNKAPECFHAWTWSHHGPTSLLACSTSG